MSYTIKELSIYPVKGLSGIKVESAVCEERGFQFDRRYLVIDDNGKFCSQRTHPKMALIKTSLEDDVLSLAYEGTQISTIWGQHSDTKINVSVWEHEFESYLISDDIDQWISNILDDKLHIVFMGNDIIRTKSFAKAPYNATLSYADGYPYLILGTASVDHLNNQLSNRIDHSRFRANIIIHTKYSSRRR